MRSPLENLEQIARDLRLETLSNRKLLQAHAALLEELRARGICRTSNNPVADYTEWLVCSELGLDQAGNSQAGYDAVDDEGLRYQIKSRRQTSHNSSVQLGAIRNLDRQEFDFLIGVIYQADFSVRYAGKIPHEFVRPHSRFSKHSNAHLFRLTPAVLAEPSVEEITKVLEG